MLHKEARVFSGLLKTERHREQCAEKDKMTITEAGENTLVLTDASEEEKKRIHQLISEKPGRQALYTRKQVAEILHLHPGSIKRYDGKLLHPLHITPRTIRYPAGQVEALLEQRGA